uniref:Uncharacterized protein n=1 Tax=Trichogramma kaykai TaxID=54128 RepID=A0ABD2WNX4_9HYME
MSKELSGALGELDHSSISEYAVQKKIRLRFNPPTASHIGGTWEHLIRSVKKALSFAIKEKNPSEEVLSTLLVEIARCVNFCLLTNISCDPKYFEALTPNHFLLGSSSGQVALPRFDKTSLSLRNQWKLFQYYADVFWKRRLQEDPLCIHGKNGKNVAKL